MQRYLKLFLLIIVILFEINASGILGEVFFKCNEVGCLISTEVIKIPKIYLHSLALLYFSVLIILVYFNKKIYYKYLLGLGSIFEFILFSILFFIFNAFCIECFFVVSILIILNLIEFKIKNLIYVVIPFSIFLIAPMDTEIKNGYTLIFKKDCPHCKIAKSNLNNSGLKYKLSNYKNHLKLLKSFNIDSVPLLIYSSKDNIQIIKGETEISKYILGLKNRKDYINDFNLFDFNKNDKEIGCSISKVEDNCH